LEENRQTLVETAEAEQNLALIIGRLEDFSDKVHQALDALDWHGTRAIIRMMIRQIEVDGDHVEIVFRVPPIMPTGDEHRPFRLTPPRGLATLSMPHSFSSFTIPADAEGHCSAP
jgi:site-specific DNA recombinase